MNGSFDHTPGDERPRGTQIGDVIRDSGLASLIALAVGGISTFLLLRDAGLGPLAYLRSHGEALWLLVVVVVATAINFGGRFLRWHYLLRAAGILLPTRESARLFFSSFSVLLTPLYVGEIIFKAFFLRNRRAVSMRRSVAIGISERAYDVVAMLLIGGVAGAINQTASVWLILLSALLVLPPVWGFALRIAAWPIAIVGRMILNVDTSSSRETMRTMARKEVAVPALLLSIVCWLPVTFSVFLICRAMGAPLGLFEGVEIFARSALVGGASLLPGGVVIAGHSMVSGLVQLGVNLSVAVAAVALVRMSTLGFAIVVGVATSIWTAARGEFANTDAQAHFDRISEVYDAEIPVHVRDYLVGRKVDLITGALSAEPRIGLDVGCGRGYYIAEFRRRGYQVVGVDLSAGQLSNPNTAGRAVAADVLRLPFEDNQFDFAYSVNLFHHLPTREMQQQGLQEVRRVLKPGGQFFLHEINTVNPLFRFYMGYVFPVIRNIDNGTERWLRPESLANHSGLTLRGVRYFTFIPDFLPLWATRWAKRIEQRMESGRWAHLSAHFVAELERTPARGRPENAERRSEDGSPEVLVVSRKLSA